MTPTIVSLPEEGTQTEPHHRAQGGLHFVPFLGQRLQGQGPFRSYPLCIQSVLPAAATLLCFFTGCPGVILSDVPLFMTLAWFPSALRSRVKPSPPPPILSPISLDGHLVNRATPCMGSWRRFSYVHPFKSHQGSWIPEEKPLLLGVQLFPL